MEMILIGLAFLTALTIIVTGLITFSLVVTFIKKSEMENLNKTENKNKKI